MKIIEYKCDLCGCIHQDPDKMLGLYFLAKEIESRTPRECERLQGYPDGWTAGFLDGVRYRMLGNSVAVPCVEWIARRIGEAR